MVIQGGFLGCRQPGRQAIISLHVEGITNYLKSK